MKNGVQLTSWQALGVGISTATKAMLKWLTTTPVGWATLAIGAIASVVGIYDLLNTSMEEASEATIDAIGELSSISSEVENLNNKIKDLKTQIDGLDPITDAEDIENLKTETQELENQLAILKEKERIAKEDADEKAQESLGKTQTSRYEFKEQEVTNALTGEVLTYNGSVEVTREKELQNAMNAHDKYYQQRLALEAELAKISANDKGYKEKENQIKLLNQQMTDARNHASELALALDEEKDGLSGVTTESKELLDSTNATLSSYTEWLNTIDGTTDALNKNANSMASANKTGIFSTFDNTNLGERLQHANKLFKEGELTHKQYFDSLQNEIDNFDASNFTDSLEDANKASQQFFTDSVQQSASGLSDLINKFDAGEMSVSEYLDGYLAIGETLSTLADNLQENSSAWDKNGEAMSDAVSSGLDSVQSDLDNAMSTITGYKDSIYSLEQIMTGAVKAGSDEFTAHTNVIAQDLANIVSSGGEMASEVANTLGTTTSEIASNLTKNVSNQSLAAQAIAANTNIAISDMATSVANIFTTLGNAISNFNVDISFSKTSGSLIDAITGNGELKFNLSASGETLSTIGDAISAFGETLALNIQPQLIEAPDFSLDVDEYTPDVDTLKNYNDELDRLKDSSKGASKSTDALTESMKKQKEALESTKSELEKQKQYYEDVAEAIDWFYDKQIEKQEKAIDSLEKENELLEERIDYYDGALSAIDRYYEKQIEKLEKQKDALAGNNKEEEIALNLEKRRQELLEARSRKTIGLYQKGKGIGYVTDTSAIKTAEENLADAQRQKEEADIDAKIDKLKEYQALWAEIPSAKQKAEEESQMIEMLGANWESILLEGRIQNITSFKEQYIAIQEQIDSNESLIASYEEKIEYYEALKTEWDNLLAKYTEDTYIQLLVGAFGNDYENELLNGRTLRWEQFAEDYYNIQVQLKEVTDQIETLAKRMEEYASRIESAANSAMDAVNDLANVTIPSVPTVNKGSGVNPSNGGGGNKYVASVKAKGGIITKKDAGEFDVIAHKLGEDHMIAIQEGEAVIPKETVAKNPEAIDSLLSGKKLDLKALVNRDIVLQRTTPLDTYSMLEKYKDWIIPDSAIISRLNLPSQDFSKLGVVNNNQKETVVQFNGDIHVHEVQNVDTLSKAIVQQLPRKMAQALSRRDL